MSLWMRLLVIPFRAFAWLVIASLVLVALYILIGRLTLLMAPHFRENVQQLLTETLNQPVYIKEIQGRWRGLDPVVIMRGMRIGGDPDSSPLELASLSIQPDVVESLREGHLRLKTLRVGALTGDLDPSVLFAQPSEQEELSHEPLSPTPEDWAWLGILDQLAIPGIGFEEIRVRLPEPHVLDEYWSLTDLVVVKKGLQVKLSGSLRNQRGDIVLARLAAEVDLSNGPQNISAKAYLQWSNGRLLLPVNAWLDSTGLRLDDLEASGEAWLDLEQGSLRNAMLRFDVRDLQWRYELEPREPIERFSGLVAWYPDDEGWRLNLSELDLNWQGRAMLAPRMTLSSKADRWAFHWEGLDVGVARAFLAHSQALSAGISERLDAYAPEGWLREGLVEWSTNDSEAPFRLVAALNGLSAKAVEGAPEGNNIDGVVLANAEGGEVRFANSSIFFHFPELYSAGWTFGHGQGRIRWEIQEGAYRVWGQDIRLSQPDGLQAHVEADFNLWVPEPEDQPNDFELSLRVSDAVAELGERFVPDRLASPEFLNWLKQSVKGGRLATASYQYTGLIGDAAPEDASVSQLSLDIEDGVLKYHPDWPALEQFNAQVRMRNGELVATVPKGKVGVTPLLRPARILLDQRADEPVISIKVAQPFGQADVDYWLQQAAIQPVTGTAFNGWQIQGGTQMDLEVRIPLLEGSPSVALGLQLNQASLRLPEPELSCREISGRLNYRSERGASGQLQAACEGQPADISLETVRWDEEQERLSIVARSRADLRALAERLEFDSFPAWVEGGTAYSLALEIPVKGEGGYHLSLTTDLQGVGLDLPRPLGRLRADATPLSIQGRWKVSPENAQWQIDWSGRLSARIRMEQGQFRRGILRFGRTLDEWPDQPGLWVDGQLLRPDLDAWSAFFKGLKSSGPGNESALLPDWFAGALLEAQDVRFSGQTVKALRVGVNPTGEGVQILFDSDGLAQGELTLPYRAGALPRLNLDYLTLSEGSASGGGDSMVPDDIPEAIVSIKALNLGERSLGQWSWTSRRSDGEIRFESLRGVLPGGTIQGRLRWVQDGVTGQQTSILTGSVEGSQFEQFYESWVETRAPLTSEKFEVDTALIWSGSPMDFSWARLNGRIGFKMEKGSFRETSRSADIFRIFGVLNTDALTRRLQLDFSDLYEQGLAYDQAEGKAGIQEGVVKFESPLAIQAPSSAFKITGTTDLGTDEIDMQMVVVLPVTKNLPLAALLVGAPQIGGALFLIDKLLGDPLSRLTSATYTIRGTLQKPEIQLQQIFENNSSEPAGTTR